MPTTQLKAHDVEPDEVQTQDSEPTEAPKTHDEPAQQTSQDAPEAEDTPQDADGEKDTKANTHKLERDVANRDKTISQLKEHNTSLEDQVRELEEKLNALIEESEQAKTGRIHAELKAMGCIDPELAAKALDTVDGDIEKLAQAKPYLFKQTQSVNTSGKKIGTPQEEAKTIAEGLSFLGGN